MDTKLFPLLINIKILIELSLKVLVHQTHPSLPSQGASSIPLFWRPLGPRDVTGWYRPCLSPFTRPHWPYEPPRMAVLSSSPSCHFATLRTARAESESDFQMSLAFLPN